MADKRATARSLSHADTILAEPESSFAFARGFLELPSAAQCLRLHLKNAGVSFPSPQKTAAGVAERLTRLGPCPRVYSQHHYQRLAFCADHGGKVGTVLLLGLSRLQLCVPAQARLLRFKARHRMKAIEEAALRAVTARKARAMVTRILPLLSVLVASVACNLVSGDGSDRPSFSLSPLSPELSKSKSSDDRRRTSAPWNYVLPVDHGVRADRSGQGHFRAPRFHGEHNGLDLLAPVGTPVFAPCTGKAMAGVSQSFGNWVHVICPVPEAFVPRGEPHPWASFFYAHLEKADLPHNQWVDVAGTQELGQVGKTGNASSDNVQPHLHLELIIQRNRRSAMDERHLGQDQSNVDAAAHFAKIIQKECMAPYGFESKTSELRRARRIDPFVALTCLGQSKPDFKRAPPPLTESSRDWAQFYDAKDFNVNLGVENSLLVAR